jgi:ribosomal protein S18 acetylase RimI-like enzyme
MQVDVRPFHEHDFSEVKALWTAVFPDDPPWNAAEVSIARKVKAADDLFLVALDAGSVVGTVMAGYDGHRGWLYSVAVVPGQQRKGIGTALVREAERRLQERGCVKINLQVRSTNAGVIAFYETLGYKIEERVSMGKRIGGADS